MKNTDFFKITIALLPKMCYTIYRCNERSDSCVIHHYAITAYEKLSDLSIICNGKFTDISAGGDIQNMHPGNVALASFQIAEI